MLKRIFIIIIYILSINALKVFSQDSTKSISQYSLMELSDITILTGCIQAENREYAPSNISIVTSQMINERGYQTLVDVCQDIPGFDFLVFNDGGGEYPTYNLHRGLGHIGNSEILIMIDGVVQNHISYNWSLLWTYESMFIDVERIEFIQGPGSVMYGAQAFSGVINIITRKDFEGLQVQSYIGSGKAQGEDVSWGKQIGKNMNYSVSFHRYQSEGDNGIGRYDPGGYFSNNIYPSTILADYDDQGNYVENTTNPYSGEAIPDGFNTSNDCYALRTTLRYKNSQLGFFLSDATKGYASELVPYEYELTEDNVTQHYRSYHINYSNQHEINTKISLTSDIVFRATHILPGGGTKYLYRFPDYEKSYASYSYQGYIEEKLTYTLTEKDKIYLGIKGALSQKSERVASLDGTLTSHSTTNSSWDIAVEGDGLYQSKEYPVYFVKEVASYLLWDRQWLKTLSSSFGVRYDFSSEYNSIFCPRFAIDYNPFKLFGVKLMYGSAFRQPSIFELTSEFRGNPDLKPQRIKTYELELNSSINDKFALVKCNIYYSDVINPIGKVTDLSMPAGEKYENIEDRSIYGISLSISSQVTNYLNVYANYNYLQGMTNDSTGYTDIDQTAAHKINAGVNLKLYKDKLISDMRMNYVGKRKAPATNTWLQTYENGDAPSYIKFNLSITYKINEHISTQAIINNLFNEQYYGVGWETGSAFIEDYDYLTNVNPEGHIPSYHPQPGRTYLLKLILNLDFNE